MVSRNYKSQWGEPTALSECRSHASVLRLLSAPSDSPLEFRAILAQIMPQPSKAAPIGCPERASMFGRELADLSEVHFEGLPLVLRPAGQGMGERPAGRFRHRTQ